MSHIAAWIKTEQADPDTYVTSVAWQPPTFADEDAFIAATVKRFAEEIREALLYS
jgi:hypothetical protein